jgi:hypothetical protein
MFAGYHPTAVGGVGQTIAGTALRAAIMPSGIRTVDNSRPPTTKNTPGSRRSIVCGKAPQLDEGVGQLVEAASNLARSSPGVGLGGVIQIGQDNDRDEGEECSPQSGREQVDLHGHSREDADLLLEGRGSRAQG